MTFCQPTSGGATSSAWWTAMELAIFKNKLKKLSTTAMVSKLLLKWKQFLHFLLFRLFINLYDFSSSVLKKKWLFIELFRLCSSIFMMFHHLCSRKNDYSSNFYFLIHPWPDVKMDICAFSKPNGQNWLVKTPTKGPRLRKVFLWCFIICAQEKMIIHRKHQSFTKN